MEGVTVQNFAEQGAPKIKKYKHFGPEGYGFIIVRNEEAEATFEETVKFNTFKGLELLKPESGSSYEMRVAPGEIKTILIKCDPEGYAMSTSSSTKVVLGNSSLEQQCIEQGKRAARADPSSGEAYDIHQYTLKHSGGIAYLYVNNTADKTLEEDLEFDMSGLEIEGKPGETAITVRVGPGQRKLVKLRTTADAYKLRVGVAYDIQ